MTTTFKDQNGRSWTLALNAPLARDINETFGIKLTALEANPFNQLEADPILLVDVLYMLCKKQCDSSNPPVSSREFGELLPPDLDPVVRALREAVINFFPGGKRSAMRSALETSEKTSNRALELLVTKTMDPVMLEQMAQLMAKQGEEAMQKAMSQDFTAMPPSVESTSAT